MRSLPAPPWTVFRTVAEERVEDHVISMTQAYEWRAGNHSEVRCAVRTAIDRWVGRGLPFERSPGGGRLFDPCEVTNFYFALGLRGEDDYWLSHCVATCRQLVRDAERATQASAPRTFRVQFRREFDLSCLAAGTAVRLRLPRPIEDAALQHLQIECETRPGVEISHQPGRVEYRLAVGSERQISLGYEATFEARPQGAGGGTLSAADRELYTRDVEPYVRVTDAIRRTADSLRTVADIRAQVMDTACLGVVQYGDLEGADPLAVAAQGGWYDCQLAAALFCALCRARGIPARVASGYWLYDALPALHYWAEAWVEDRGWMPYDFFAWGLSAGGKDTEWRDVFAGVIDCRMKTQVFPHLVTGPGSIRFGRWWHMTSRLVPPVLESTYESAPGGELIYRDRISIHS